MVKIGKKKYIAPAFLQEDAVVIVLACTDEYIPYCSVTIESLIEHAKPERNYDIVIFSYEITKQHQQAVTKQAEHHSNISIRFVDVRAYISKYHLYTRDYYHPIIYARLCLAEIMRNYRKVVYLDSDLVVLEDIAELFDQDIGNHLIAGVRDMGMITWYHTPEHIEQIYIDKYLHLKYPNEYINTGVMIFHVTEIRRRYSAKYLMEYATSRKWKWQDQDIFMTLFEGNIFLLDDEWNVLINTKRSYKKKHSKQHPKIVHYIENSFLNLQEGVELGELFWGYARKSPFYELIIGRALAQLQKKRDRNIWNDIRKALHIPFKVLFDFLFPKGSGYRRKVRYLYYFLRYWR